MLSGIKPRTIHTNPPLFICVFNYGAIHLGLNHLQSLRRAGITNYKAYVTDQASVNALSERGHPVEYINPREQTEEYGTEKLSFDSPTFNSMSYLRYKVIVRLLEQGITVWYMDVDTVVLQNLLPVYDRVKMDGADIYFQDDVNMPCSGCMLCWPNQATIRFLNVIEQNKCDKYGDQMMVLNVLNKYPKSVKRNLFDRTEFPNGLLFFCDELEDQEMVTTFNKAVVSYKNAENKNTYFVHANWMIGNDVKMAALKKRGLWFL